MAQPIPQALSHLITVNPVFSIIICIPCQYAITPNAIVRHLRDQHQTDREKRKQMEAYIEGFPFVYDHISIELPPENSAPQPIIPVVDGFQCYECTFKSQSRKKIKQHGNKEHKKKWVADQDLFQAVRLQSWFSEKKARYWVVDEAKGQQQARRAHREQTRDIGEEIPDSEDDDPRPQGAIDDEEIHDGTMDEIDDDEIVQEIEQWKADAQERRLELLAKAPASEIDPWLKYTQWNTVLNQSQHNLVDTFHFTRMPDPAEPQLTRLLQIWKGILNRCLDTLDGIDHRDVLKWWASPQNEAASQRPFELPQNAQTINKYSGYFEGFICYMIRTAPMDDWEEATETGVKYTEGQWRCIRYIRQKLDDDRLPAENEHGDEGDEGDEGGRSGDRDMVLTNALMCLCQLTVMQDTSRIGLYDSAMMHYLAVRGFDPETQSFRVAFFYTPILAGMLWINRVIALEIAVPLRPWPTLRLESKDEMASVSDRIHAIRRQHLCEGSFSPTSSILTQLAMGKRFNKQHQSPSNIHWSTDEQTIYYLGRPILLTKIEAMCQRLIDKLRTMMRSLTFDAPVPPVNLHEIVDSMAWSQAFRRQGFSFIDHIANQEQTQGDWRYLYERARKGEGRWTMFTQKPDRTNRAWVKGQLKAYLSTERQFLRTLMVCMHITGGQPARGPELGSIKVCNSVYSARNIYVINGRVCFLTMYDKARRRRGNTEYIVRCVPDAVSQIVAQYLIRVRPFARALDRRESEYLFADKRGPWAGEQLSEILKGTTRDALGVQLTISGWRHVAIGIATRKLMRASKTWETDAEGVEGGEEEFAEGDDAEELEVDTFRHVMVRQAGHGRRVAQAHYAIDGAFLHRLGPELVSAYEQASMAWHRLFKLDEIPSERGDEDGDEMPSEGLTEGEGLREGLRERSKEGEGLRERSRERSREGSKDRRGSKKIGEGQTREGVHNRGLREGKSQEVHIGHRRHASPGLGVTRPIKRERRATSDSVLIGLQRIYHDPHAKPRSEGQAAALELVHHPSPTRPLVIVLSTSSGKSALFFSVAAVTQQQTVIVVVPFAALVDDVIERGQKAGLNCEEWVGEASGHELRQLIVVSADRAVQGEFLHYAKGLELEGQLAHVFFDECHVAYTDTSYRERLRMLWTLRYLDCPFTALTATLMIPLEAVLKERLCIDNARIFRRNTARKTIRYRVHDSKNEAPSEVAIRQVGATTLGAGQRGVIYVRSYATGEMISEKMGCPFYRAQAEDKGAVLQMWVQGAGGWIVATGALGTGINIEGIVMVIHVSRPYGLTSFVQQSGRGGRNGEVSESIIITRVENSQGHRRREMMSAYSVEQIDEDAMTEYIQSRGCRRVVLGRYMDGLEEDEAGDGGEGQMSCHAMDGILCDRCKVMSRVRADDGQVGGEAGAPAGRVLVREVASEAESPTGREAAGEREVGPSAAGDATHEVTGATVIQHRLQAMEARQEEMMEVMKKLQGSCVYCELIHGEIDVDHGPHGYQECTIAAIAGCPYEQYQGWRHGIDLGTYQHCWTCGLSQRICRRLEDDGWCEYPEIMLPSIYVLYQRGYLEEVVHAVGFRGEMEGPEVWEWLEEIREGFGEEWESQWMATWREVCRVYSEMKRKQSGR